MDSRGLKYVGFVVIALKDNDNEYLLDAYNNLVFQIVGCDLQPIEQIKRNDTFMTQYPDSNIKEIGRVLKKYYKLKELGIDYLYNYDY